MVIYYALSTYDVYNYLFFDINSFDIHRTVYYGTWFNGGQNIIDILLQNTVMDQAGEWGIGIVIARIGMLIYSIQWLIFYLNY